ncbi:MAG: MFS transporter [Nocardiopsaceae bacterium]|nr:MFS transporter [Nocardiopsaceae bacterium]
MEARGKASGGLWRHRDFLLLWGGQTVSEMGSAVTQLALPLTAVVLLNASTFGVGLLTAAATLAFAVIALPAGALVDRRAKRGVMIACDAARLLIIASVPVAWAAGVLTMAQLYVVAIAAGVCTVFFDVSYQSYLPSLLRTEHLMDGNGKLGASQSFAQLAGPGLGGGLVGAFGAAGAMTADAVSYAVSVASLLGIRHREAREEPSGDGPARPSLRADIAEGLRFVLGHPILRKVVACTGTANLFGSASTAVEIIFLIRVLGVPPAYTGLVFAVAAVGGVAGGVLSGRIARRVGSARVIWFSVLVLGAPQLLAAFAWPGWGVALYPVGFAFMFFSAVVYNVAQVSYRQTVCPPRLMGRMNAATRWIVWGTMPLGGVIGGALGTAIGVRPTLAIGLAGSWAAGFWVYFSPLRRLRDVPSADPAPAPR